MNLPITQPPSNINDWVKDIKIYAKAEMTRLKKILHQNNCSNSVKINILEGFKETLKMKLKEVQNAKQRFQSEISLPKCEYENNFKLTSDKDYIVISGKVLTQIIDEHQEESMRKMESLIEFKKKVETKKKTELKSQYKKLTSTQNFEGFYIPSAKMTSSIVVPPQNKNHMNKSTMMGSKTNLKISMDRSLQARSKSQMSKVHQTEMCQLLEPIVQEARQICRKNKYLINCLEKGHKSQLDLNVWLKCVKLETVKGQLKKVKTYKKEQQKKLQNNDSDTKVESTTTGSPDEKDISDAKNTLLNSESKKFECVPRKNLLQEENVFSINLEKIEEKACEDSKNEQTQKDECFSPKEGRKTTSKMNRPSGYIKNTTFNMIQQQEFLNEPKEAYFQCNRARNQQVINEDDQESRKNEFQNFRQSLQLKNKSRILNNFGSKELKNELESVLSCQTIGMKIGTGIITNVKFQRRIFDSPKIIQEQDEDKLQESPYKNQSQSQEEVYEQYLKIPPEKEIENFKRSQEKKLPQGYSAKPTISQLFKNFNHSYENEQKKSSNEQSNKQNGQKSIQQQQNIFKQLAAPKVENIFKVQQSFNTDKTQIYNSQNKENNPFYVNNTVSKNIFKSKMPNKNFLNQNLQHQPTTAIGLQHISFSKESIHQKQRSSNPFQKIDHSQNTLKPASQNIFFKAQEPTISAKSNLNIFNTKVQNVRSVFETKKDDSADVYVQNCNQSSCPQVKPLQVRVVPKKIPNEVTPVLRVQEKCAEITVKPVKATSGQITLNIFASKNKDKSPLGTSGSFKRRESNSLDQNEDTPQDYPKKKANELEGRKRDMFTYY